MRGLVSKTKAFFGKNGSTILTYAGGIGSIATAVMAVKATPKALQLMEDAKTEKGEPLTKFEIVKTAAPVYIPSITVGATTLLCIFGSNILNKRQQASLLSAYAFLGNSFKEYRNKVNDIYGEDADATVQEAIAEDHNNNNVLATENEIMFYDAFSKQYFKSTLYKVQQAEYLLNRDLIMRDYAYLNEFYEHLDIDEVDDGWKMGWSTGSCLAAYWQPWIDFNHSRKTLDDGTECIVITMFQEPFLDFEDYC